MGVLRNLYWTPLKLGSAFRIVSYRLGYIIYKMNVIECTILEIVLNS